MTECSKLLNYEVIGYFPEDFFNKNVNEPFIKKIMSMVLKSKEWTRGDPDCGEPDYFCGNVPFEFTLASDKRKKNNFIQNLIRMEYTSEDVEADAISFIKEQIEAKAKKKYSVSNVHLCVLCVLDLLNWVSDEYGSYTHALTDYKRKEFFDQLKAKYIDNETFGNIFIIVPDLSAKWWVFDILSGHKASVQIDIRATEFPYIITKKAYEKIYQSSVQTLPDESFN